MRRRSTSWSVMPARRPRGQYSQTWLSQRMRRVLASSSVTSLLKRASWPSESSVLLSCAAYLSCSMMRRRTSPRRVHAAPRLAGSEAAISRRMREASLHPRPLVVTPTCSAPSVCVDNRLNVHRCGASTTLIGMRFRRQSCAMCVVFGDEEVMKTASTTPSTSARPRRNKSPSSNVFCSHFTLPSSSFDCRP